MYWHGRGNSGGSWLPVDKKANMWHGRGNNGGSWPPAFPRSQEKDVESGDWRERKGNLGKYSQRSERRRENRRKGRARVKGGDSLKGRKFGGKCDGCSDHIMLFLNTN